MQILSLTSGALSLKVLPELRECNGCYWCSYLYAVCDITTTLEQILDFHDFSQTPDKLGYYKYNDKMNAYIEILSYDKIINDAKKRNRILFDKLGI